MRHTEKNKWVMIPRLRTVSGQYNLLKILVVNFGWKVFVEFFWEKAIYDILEPHIFCLCLCHHNMSYLKSFNPLLSENIACNSHLKHFVFVNHVHDHHVNVHHGGTWETGMRDIGSSCRGCVIPSFCSCSSVQSFSFSSKGCHACGRTDTRTFGDGARMLKNSQFS